MSNIKLITVLMLLVGLISSIGCAKAETIKTGISIELEWSEDFPASEKIATEKNLPILIDFSGSDWCGWCIKLDDEVFNTVEFKEYADKNLVLLKADFPKKLPQTDELVKQNRDLMDKYGVRGFPTIILISSDGTLIGQTGYQPGGPVKYIEHLNSFLTKQEK
ncbi:MAG: thioredoxin family protein [Candidatus Zophobacter franzmannii]|nr:thioredoxin family protein [Candidatus Zophobacter franzmannii]